MMFLLSSFEKRRITMQIPEFANFRSVRKRAWTLYVVDLNTKLNLFVENETHLWIDIDTDVLEYLEIDLT